jgi:manganese transport protein
MFTGDKLKMGQFANPRWMNVFGWVLAAVIAVLNAILLCQVFAGH